MGRNLLCLVSAAVLLAGCVAVHETKQLGPEQEALVELLELARRPAQVLRHVVLFKFKDGTTNEQIRKIENAFCAIPSKVDTVYDFEWGTDVSVENRHKGFTHCFVVTFLSEADRGEYLPHPAHNEFVETILPHVDDVLVVDYWTK